jgi:hypothetical protein
MVELVQEFGYIGRPVDGTKSLANRKIVDDIKRICLQPEAHVNALAPANGRK